MKRTLVIASAIAVLAGNALGARQSVVRTIYVSAVDKSDKPVLDMAANEFDVREGGKVQEATARLAAAPLRVALLVADHGSGAFQGGALRLCEALLGHAAISLVGIIVQPERLTDYSSAPDVLREGLNQLGRRRASTEPGAQLTEAIYETARSIQPGTRSAIVVIRAGAEALGSVRIDQVQDAIRASGAVLYVVSSTTSDYRTSVPSTVQLVLNDSSRESGGRRIDVVGGTLVPTMQQIAAELINQYEITYTLPAGTRPSDSLSVKSKRPNVVVRAPTRLAK